MKRHTVASLRRRRLAGGVVASAAVLAVAYHPLDYPTDLEPAGATATSWQPSPMPTIPPPGGATDPGCTEDQGAFVAPARAGDPSGLRWVCVTLDDVFSPAALAELDAGLADR